METANPIKLNLDKQSLKKLQHLTGTTYDFLGFKLDLEESTLFDSLGGGSGKYTEWQIQLITVLLCHYSAATIKPPAGILVKFRGLPGGCAYEEAFIKRAIKPIAVVFGDNPRELPLAAQLLGGKQQLNMGDASVEISALKGIPLTYILWGRDEFPSSVNILYDQSASNYLPTEDLAVLGELTTSRLLEAKGVL